MAPVPVNPRRKSMRLDGYDYSYPGAYFITTVTRNRECLFGEVVNGDMRLNQYGLIVQNVLQEITIHYPQVTLETFVIMPNHVHAVVVINDLCRGGSQTLPYKMMQQWLPEIVRALKSFSARRINQLRNMPGVAVWQRSFYDHVIRDEQDLNNITDYIQTNPQNWNEDRLFKPGEWIG